jgi:hypothetical protein
MGLLQILAEKISKKLIFRAIMMGKINVFGKYNLIRAKTTLERGVNGE